MKFEMCLFLDEASYWAKKLFTYINLLPLTPDEDIREVKHDVYGKRQKWNFCRLSSALCTVESKHLYLLWIVKDTSLFSCDLFKDHKKMTREE